MRMKLFAPFAAVSVLTCSGHACRRSSRPRSRENCLPGRARPTLSLQPSPGCSGSAELTARNAGTQRMPGDLRHRGGCRLRIPGCRSRYHRTHAAGCPEHLAERPETGHPGRCRVRCDRRSGRLREDYLLEPQRRRPLWTHGERDRRQWPPRAALPARIHAPPTH